MTEAVKKGGLAAVIGLTAAALLSAVVSREESGGRKYHDAYLDMIGVATICDGLTHYEDGRTVRVGDHRTEEQCGALLDAELTKTAKAVLSCTPNLKGHDNQTVAAISLAYNIGNRAYCHSGVDRAFDAGQWRTGCDAMLRWKFAGGRVVKGLADRRARERAICLRGL